jgi:hypothetical protein
MIRRQFPNSIKGSDVGADIRRGTHACMKTRIPEQLRDALIEREVVDWVN